MRRILLLSAVALVMAGVLASPAWAANLTVAKVPQAPKSERLRLTIPRLERVRDIPVYTGGPYDKDKLAAGVLHIEDTGFPWQPGSNTYIAGHRHGYRGTKSWLVFWHLNALERGDRVILKDAKDRRYEYEVFDKEVVEPSNVSVKKPIEGKSIVTLQTCTLPDYRNRLIVRAQRVTD